ncbi:MAG: hypothetical protein D6706_07075 [Chloroflexi bacterium]|nr:MAG: hypothetical protein D6706_07075 [Chloroflexota bacterium]
MMMGLSMKSKQILGCVIGLMVLVLAGCEGRGAETAVSQGENGIAVAPEFVTFYEQYGGARVFGDPITVGFRAEPDGPLIQYFQRMRLEYVDNSDLDESERVVVYPLGRWALEGLEEQVLADTTIVGEVREFEATGFSVQDEFLTFYETYGGTRLFGLPISPQLLVDGQRVQYFENGRLEWHPELPSEQRVQVGLLGQAHFDSVMAFTYRQLLLAQPTTPDQVQEATVFAYVKAPILYQGEQQYLYVTVLTPEGNPVSNIQVEATFRYGETTQTITLGQTNEKGRVFEPVNIQIPPGNQVKVEVNVYNNGIIIGTTRLTFRTWW